MSNVKVLFVLLILISVLAVLAHAAPNGQSRRATLSSQSLDIRSLVAESEPNNDCATATTVAAGDLVTAFIDPALDQDYFALTANAGDLLYIHTILEDDVPGYLVDSIMTLFADDCTTILATNDDAINWESVILHEFTSTGTYYIMVEGYDESVLGEYQLALEAVALQPVGDTCEEVTPIPSGDFEFTATTEGLTNDYLIPLFWMNDGAPDVVFGFVLEPGEYFDAEIVAHTSHMIFYMVTDCSDEDAFLVMGNTGPFPATHYINASGESQSIYLIVDGADAEDAGPFVMRGHNDGSAIVANEDTTWGGLKLQYR